MKQLDRIVLDVYRSGKADYCAILGLQTQVGTPDLPFNRFVFTGPEIEQFGKLHGVFKDLMSWMSVECDAVQLLRANPPQCAEAWLHLPQEVRKEIVQRVTGLRAELETSPVAGSELRYVYTRPVIEQWCKIYGRSYSRIMWSSTTATFYRTEKCASLTEALRRLTRIARNHTRKRAAPSFVNLSRDWDGFYFDIVDPQNRRVMNGGIVRHGDQWSIHT